MIHAHYLSLDNDRLLKVYRQHAGLDAPGKDMGGWYDVSGFVPGHTFGQYISGLARFGRGAGDPACHAKVRLLVEGFGKLLKRNPDPYAGPSAEKLWPAYVLDKHEIGLIDAYRLGLTALPQKRQENAQAANVKDQVFVPFYLVRDESYDTYFQSV